MGSTEILIKCIKFEILRCTWVDSIAVDRESEVSDCTEMV
jgi:hypothetical protein